MNGIVPGDFSSAAFPACAAAISGGTVELLGLDPEDTQGDKAVFEHLALMGCDVEWRRTAAEWVVRISRNGPLKPVNLDLNATPDALPALAATLCYAEGTSFLRNVPNARIKETDRIAVMAAELSKLGVAVREMPDGLAVVGCASAPAAPAAGAPAALAPAARGAPAPGGAAASSGSGDILRLQGHGDHRVVMALAIAALGADRLGASKAHRPISIDTAESAAVTYPGFLQLIGARLADDPAE